jgi:AcrR family transcriptional regulator
VSSQLTSAPRRQLKPRQAETVRRLLDAGAALLTEVGPDALTIRQVALRAGVSSATAYTYFSSKGHLVAELFWRALVEDDAGHQPTGDTPVARVQSVTRHLTDLLEASPQLAAAVTGALLGTDPDVDRLRLRIGGEFVARFEAALGEAATPAVVDALTLAFSGALLQAGMGLLTYADLGERLDVVVATILEGTV